MDTEARFQEVANPPATYLKAIRVCPRLAGFVDGMWEWDVPDATTGRAITGKLLPSVAPQFAVHYGSPMMCDRMGGAREYQQIAHGIQTKVVTARPTGPIHAITIRLKPEAAPLFMGPYLGELRDAHVELRDLFPSSEVSELVERLAEAVDSRERVATIESFLISRMRHTLPAAALFQAARRLQDDCTLSVRALASELHLSERHLRRKFTAAYGVSPKQFARLVRMTRALELRQRGFGWLDVVSSCGFSDQAHLINDFNGLVSHAPEHFYRMISAGRVREMNASLCKSIISNTYVV
jgi:AraC-like DNA-binding protein